MSDKLQHITNIPQYIFGQSSSMGDQSQITSPIESGSINVWVAIFVLFAAFLYLLWFNHWSARGGIHTKMFKFFGYHRGNYESKLDVITPSFKGYIRSGNIIATITLIIGINTIIEHFWGAIKSPILGGFGWGIYGATLAALVAIYIFQFIVIRTIGWVMQSKDFSDILLFIKGTLLNVFAIFITPTILCLNLSHSTMQNILFYTLAAQIAATAIIFLYESFFLFLKKKVSVLHTILYLCAVEIFPLTLIWGIFSRL